MIYFVVFLLSLHPLQVNTRTFFINFKMASSKKVTLSVLSREQSEGVGARVRRSIGGPEVSKLDECFLLRFFLSRGTGGILKGIWEEKAKMVTSFPVVFQWEKHETPQLGPHVDQPCLKEAFGMQN